MALRARGSVFKMVSVSAKEAFHKENICPLSAVIRYPSVKCIGLRRPAAGSILFSRSLLNSKASSTRNGFNNMSLWPHKMTQAL